jgi:secreted protein with Ig-like and vWFA domain
VEPAPEDHELAPNNLTTRSPAESIKPVTRPPPDPIPACVNALVFVIDRSGSMSGLPMETAKSGTKEAIGQLTKDDCFSLVIFDSHAERVIPLTHVVDRPALEAKIDSVTAAGGTDIFEGLRLGYEDATAAVKAPRRVVVLLTDGQSSEAKLRETARAMAADKIELSTIGIGAGINEPLLRALAADGGGRMYYARVLNELKPAIAKEGAAATRR